MDWHKAAREASVRNASRATGRSLVPAVTTASTGSPSGGRHGPQIAVRDAGWPKLPSLGEAVTLTSPQIAAMAEWLRSAWPGSSAR